MSQPEQKLATITFATYNTQAEVLQKLQTTGILALLAKYFGAYPVVSVEPRSVTPTGKEREGNED